MHFKTLSIININTEFGPLSIQVKESSKEASTITINHQFNKTPKSIFLDCPIEYNAYSFDDSSKNNDNKQPNQRTC